MQQSFIYYASLFRLGEVVMSLHYSVPLRRVHTAACIVLLAGVMPVSYAQTGSDDSALGTIVVTATATEKTLRDAPASMSVVDGDALRQRPMNDIGEALRDLPGVHLESVGLGNTGVSIRGMSSEHTLFLIDGERINTSAGGIAHSNYELNWLPPEAIERVEVVRGPMSSLYGSEALGGVVNIITRKATDTWHGSVTTYGLFSNNSQGGNHYKTGVYVGGPLIKDVLGINVWGQVNHRIATYDAVKPALTALDRQHSTTGNVALTWTPTARQRIDATVSEGDEERLGVRAGTGSAVYSSQDDIKRRRISLSHTAQWDHVNTQVRLYRSTLERINTRSDGGSLSGPNYFTDTVFDAKASLSPLGSHQLTGGVEARRETLEDPTVNRAGKSTLDHYAVYLQDDIALGKRANLVIGNRFDQHEQFGWQLSPRAYALYRATDALTVKAGVGRGFKAPTLKQISPQYESWAAMGGRGIIYGNPDLQPETNTSYELGLEYQQGATTARAMLFQNNVKNLIETQRMPTCAVAGKTCLNYRNVGRVVMRGIELGAATALPGNLHLDVNYMYLDARDKSTDLRLADRSRHSANTQLTWYAGDKLSTSAKLEYIGAQYRSATAADRPGYTLVSLYADYAITQHLKLNTGIENITNKQLANDDASVYARADEGRRYFVSMTASF
jgi:outer membrane receptor for ferrienterochelin and colicins